MFDLVGHPIRTDSNIVISKSHTCCHCRFVRLFSRIFSKMTHRLKQIELPEITFETSSDLPSPVSTASFESLDLQSISTLVVSTPSKSQSTHQLTLSSPTKSFCSTASACRICHEGDSIGPLMSPCECRGTIALVHNYCLEKWLTTANSSHCEVCQYTFKVCKIPPSSTQWLTNQSARTLYFDICCVLFFVPGGLIVSYFCSQTAIFYIRQGKWEGLGLLLITAMLFFCFTVWIYFTIKFHIRNFRVWRNSHPEIQLIPSRLRLSNRSRASARNHIP